MNATAEVKVGAREIVAIAIAEDTELKGGKQCNFHRAGKGRSCAVGSTAAVSVNFVRFRLPGSPLLSM